MPSVRLSLLSSPLPARCTADLESAASRRRAMTVNRSLFRRFVSVFAVPIAVVVFGLGWVGYGLLTHGPDRRYLLWIHSPDWQVLGRAVCPFPASSLPSMEELEMCPVFGAWDRDQVPAGVYVPRSPRELPSNQ